MMNMDDDPPWWWWCSTLNSFIEYVGSVLNIYTHRETRRQLSCHRPVVSSICMWWSRGRNVPNTPDKWAFKYLFLSWSYPWSIHWKITLFCHCTGICVLAWSICSRLPIRKCNILYVYMACIYSIYVYGMYCMLIWNRNVCHKCTSHRWNLLQIGTISYMSYITFPYGKASLCISLVYGY